MVNAFTTSSRAAADGEADAPRRDRVVVLAIGDLVVFLVFVVVGLSSHKETLSVGNIVHTAAPFVIAWAVIAPALGAFGHQGSASTTLPRFLLSRTLLAWAVAGPVGLALRDLVFRDVLAPAFIAIALVFNAILLLAWRGVLSALVWRR